MAKRIISTVLLWVLVICSLVFFRTEGGVALITLISVLTLREFYKLMQGAGLAPFDKLGMTIGGLITLAPYLEARFQLPATHMLAIAVVITLPWPHLWGQWITELVANVGTQLGPQLPVPLWVR